MMSQRTGVDRPPAATVRDGHAVVDSRPLFKKWIESPFRPEDNLIIVDSTGSPEILWDNILKRIIGGVDHVG